MEVTPTQETSRQSSFQRESRAFFFFFFHSRFIGLQVAVMFKRRTTLNTLVEILSALHLALFLCSVWSRACTILCWIFSFWRKLHKGGASIIHDARFRFVPHCSESENSPPCYFAEEPWISFFFFLFPFKVWCTVQQLLTKRDTLLITHHFYCKCNGEERTGWMISRVCDPFHY